MKLAEKIRYLREVEGSLRGLNRPMTQLELVTAVRKEQGKSISQSYISQIEGGSRRHMTQASRSLLAKVFKVHPGFLVDDPEGYHTELTSDLRTVEGKLDVWLLQGSERFAGDRELSEVLMKAAREKDTRKCLLLVGAILHWIFAHPAFRDLVLGCTGNFAFERHRRRGHHLFVSQPRAQLSR